VHEQLKKVPHLSVLEDGFLFVDEDIEMRGEWEWQEF
jgi:hypothetical protein